LLKDKEMEIWKNIKDYEGLYQVSNTGKVKSLKRVSLNSGSYSGSVLVKEKELKQTINKYGYHVVTLFKNGVRKFMTVHRLVAQEFIYRPNEYREVNHLDLNKSNNHVTNLQWCNREQNINHYYENSNKSSKYKGISYSKERNKWCAYIDINKKRFSLGRFKTELEAKEYREDFINNLKKQSNEKCT